jgi:type III pantothenate kinase
MLLAFDIGNSTVNIGLFDGEDFRKRMIPTDPGRTAESYSKIFEEFFGEAKPECIIVSSVVPAVSQSVKTAVRRVLKAEPLVVGPGCSGGMTLDVDEPDTVGSDRIASSAGAAAILGTPCVSVDLGTATTVNFVTEGKKGSMFSGGAILPGINMQLRALNEGTVGLPFVSPSGEVRALGKTTEQNIRTGVLMGTAGAVEHIILQAEREFGLEFKIALTGGMMEYMEGVLENVHMREPNLVLKGLRAIYESEQDK